MIFYSTSTCKNCGDLKKKLDEVGIKYTVNQNVEEMAEKGIRSVPQVLYKGQLYNYNQVVQDLIPKYKLENKIIEKIESNELLNPKKMMSDAKFYEGYARYIDAENRYESWTESVERVMQTHRRFYAEKITPDLEVLLKEVEEGYKEKLFLGAQRVLQFGGDQLIKHCSRTYNCSASYVDRPDFFGGMFYLALSGCGVGFSVQKEHIAKLPNIKKRNPLSAKVHIVEDSIEGWASTIDALLSSYFTEGAVYPEYKGKKVFFDLTQIRPKGAFISGGFKAPGPEPLRKALDKIEQLIETEINKGETKLRPIVAYDVAMYIADAVISGGVRRSATICMFSLDDKEMMNAKTGNWFIDNPQRGRKNYCVHA